MVVTVHPPELCGGSCGLIRDAACLCLVLALLSVLVRCAAGCGARAMVRRTFPAGLHGSENDCPDGTRERAADTAADAGRVKGGTPTEPPYAHPPRPKFTGRSDCRRPRSRQTRGSRWVSFLALWCTFFLAPARRCRGARGA